MFHCKNKPLLSKKGKTDTLKARSRHFQANAVHNMNCISAQRNDFVKYTVIPKLNILNQARINLFE
jgi:hypothetical protein